MEPNPPLTAKEAALRGAQADKPPFNPEADRRHVIASAIRLASEATGQSEPAADEIQHGPTPPDEAGEQGMLGGPEEQPQRTADWATPVDSPAAGDLSLANMIMADQAASYGFAMPPAMPGKDETSPPLGSSFDALQSPSWIAATVDTQADTSPRQSAFPPLAQFIDATTPPISAPFNVPFGIPAEFPLIENSQFDASARGIFNTPSPFPSLPPNIRDLFGRNDTADTGVSLLPCNPADTGSISLLPYNPADEPAGPKVQLLSSGASAADAAPADESRAPITYLPFGQPAPSPHGDSAPREKRRFEFESGFADVGKDAAIAFLAMEPAILKAIEQAGEQDRHDAFMRESSRGACL